jgi:hypothetical protein
VYPDYVLYHTVCDVNDVNEPVTLKEALSSVSGKNWEIAAKMEFDSLMKNGIWDLVDLPVGKKAVSCKWVFKLKSDANGEVKYKA